MSGNRYKSNSVNEDPNRPNVFGWLRNRLPLSNSFEDGVPSNLVPRLVFLTVLGVIYIGNRHYSEKLSREIDELEVTVEDLRADFTTIKANYMKASKRSEVLRKVKGLGLIEAEKPPYKIMIDKSEF